MTYKIKREISEQLLAYFIELGSRGLAVQEMYEDGTYLHESIGQMDRALSQEDKYTQVNKAIQDLTEWAVTQTLYATEETPPDMADRDKIDDAQLEEAFARYTEGMTTEGLEAELQIYYADKSPISEVDILMYILRNSFVVAPTHSIKEYVKQGYEFMYTFVGDETQTLVSKIDNLEDYIYG